MFHEIDSIPQNISDIPHIQKYSYPKGLERQIHQALTLYYALKIYKCSCCSFSMIFNTLRERDPLKIILSIWTPKNHVRLINTRLYVKHVVSIKMRVC